MAATGSCGYSDGEGGGPWWRGGRRRTLAAAATGKCCTNMQEVSDFAHGCRCYTNMQEVSDFAHWRRCCTNMQEGGDFAHGRRFCTMNCITSYWLLCENALDGISSSVVNYLSEKCVMIAHKTYAQNMVLNNGACMIQQKCRIILSCNQCLVFGEPLRNQLGFL